ncbi:hypothetical protein [Mycolicibacterium rutilum]|uniref:hypothetical protein n=1 Tax=Mycolicibacterium rutilum TaxID=370526 RepID=UPI0009F25E12|nr:hypothetical protein [Mycolicibacterium rutilum]
MAINDTEADEPEPRPKPAHTIEHGGATPDSEPNDEVEPTDHQNEAGDAQSGFRAQFDDITIDDTQTDVEPIEDSEPTDDTAAIDEPTDDKAGEPGGPSPPNNNAA